MNNKYNLDYLSGLLTGLEIEHKDENGNWLTRWQLCNNIANEWHEFNDAIQEEIAKCIIRDDIREES